MKAKAATVSILLLTVLLTVWGVFVAVDWVGEYMATKQSPAYEELPFEFKLKSNPEDVIFSEAYMTASGTDIVKYAYVAGEVGPQLNEDISRRTPGSYTEVINQFKNEEGKPMETLKTTFLSKPQFYEKDGQWRQIEYATTTPEIFAMSGAIPHIKKRELVERLLPGTPVYATVSTFYPDPNTEVTSVDGDIAASGDSFSCDFLAWDNARDAGFGGASDSGTSIFAYSSYVDNGDCTDHADINRTFLLFDTSALTASAVVSASTLSVYIPTKYQGVNDGFDILYLDATSPTSNTALIAGDIDNVSTIAQSGTTPDITSISTGAYTSFTLNSTGLGNIAKTGVSKYGVRTGHDFLNSPSGVSATGVLISAAETSGTSQDPKLEVTYTLPSIFSFGNWLPF